MSNNTKGPGPGGPGGGPRNHGFRKPKNTKKTLIRMFAYLSGNLPLLMLAMVMIVLSALAGVASAYMLKPVVNNLTSTLADLIKNGMTYSDARAQVLTSLGKSLAVMAVIYFVGAVGTYLSSRIMVSVAQRTANKMRKELFEHLQDLPVGYFDKHPHGEVMSRFTNDMDNVAITLEQSLSQTITSVISVVGTFVMMVVLSWVLTILVILILILMFFIIKAVGGRSAKYFRKQQANLGELDGYIEEMMQGQKVVKVFNHEDAANEEFIRKNRNLRDAAVNAQTFATVLMPIMGNLSYFHYAVTATVGAVMIVNPMGWDIFAATTIGDIAAFLQYTRQFSQPITQISNQMNMLLSALAGAERIFEVIDEVPEQDSGSVSLVLAEAGEDGALREVEGDPFEDFASTFKSGSGRFPAWKVPAGIKLAGEESAASGAGDSGDVRGAGDVSAAVDASAAGGASDVSGAGAAIGVSDASAAGAAVDVSTAGAAGSVRGTTAAGDRLIKLHGDVRFHDVVFAYVPGHTVLNGLSLYAKPGQKIAFVGSTGAGKTTITNLINRFYEIQSGVITYDGIDVRDIKKDDLRRTLGIVLQDVHLFRGTIKENIRYGKLDATDEEVVRAAKIANAHSFIKRLPDGYDTMLSADGMNLSQGQRQLLSIARAAVADPPVIILDEATSSIDTRTEHLIEDGMDKLMMGRTTFVIAHRLSTVRNSNAIMVLEHGEIIERGDHDDLLAQKGRYYSLYTGKAELT